MVGNRKISTYIQGERTVKEQKGVDLVSILVKNVGCSDNEKQEVKKDERRLMKAMAICDGSEGGPAQVPIAKLLEMSHALILLHFR